MSDTILKNRVTALENDLTRTKIRLDEVESILKQLLADGDVCTIRKEIVDAMRIIAREEIANA